MLSNKQYRFLKYIYDTKTIGKIRKKYKFKDYQDINNTIDNPIDYFVYNDCNYDDNTVVSLTNLGRALVDNHYDISKKFWIPTVISIIALLKSFSGELAQLLTLIMRLLK